jgi:hypothetical protein
MLVGRCLLNMSDGVTALIALASVGGSAGQNFPATLSKHPSNNFIAGYVAARSSVDDLFALDASL